MEQREKSYNLSAHWGDTKSEAICTEPWGDPHLEATDTKQSMRLKSGEGTLSGTVPQAPFLYLTVWRPPHVTPHH